MGARGKVAAIVQARMSSSRLPGKVLEEIGAQPAILFQLQRLTRAHELDELIVATSTEPSDDRLAECVAAAGYRLVRGSLEDVLGRYEQAGSRIGCDAVVRLTGDCPLLDPEVVDLVVARWRAGDEDFVANCFEPRTYPPGMDTEVISWPILAEAAREATAEDEREHVTPFVRRRPERYKLVRLDLDPPAADVRLVLDTEADLAYLRALVERVGPEAPLAEILAAAANYRAGETAR